ncbi:MAG: hypothetical protein Q9166_003414 [cf. Caloplaca sp. 2 TL-2023]
MSSIHHAHLRTSPTQSRKTTVKAARAAPLGGPKPFLKGNGKSKHGKDKPKEKEDEVIDDDNDDDDMATSFPQFCCKRIDAQHVTDYDSYLPMSSPVSSELDDIDFFGSKEPRIVARAIPTPRPILSARIPPEAHEGKSDLDPTEWKPKLVHRPTSDASKYLSQFHRTPPAYGSPRRGSPHRPAAVSAQTMNSVLLNAPSLSATPSASSTSSGDSSAGTPYDFVNHRPNPVHSKSVNLVTPQKAPTAYSVPAKPTAGGQKLTLGVSDLSALALSDNVGLSSDLSYEKKCNMAASYRGLGTGSLTRMLGGTSLDHKGTL